MIASILNAPLMDHLSNVWLELAMATLAAIVYFALSGKKGSATRRPPKLVVSRGPEEQNHFPRHNIDSSHAASGSVRHGKIRETISLIQRMPETKEGHVPSNLAYNLLAIAAKFPKLKDVAADLKILTGKISPHALDMALMEAMKAKDIAAARQLHMISGLLLIPKSQQAFEALAKAYASDSTALHVLVEEAKAPLTRSFAELALEACTRFQDSRLAAEIFEKLESSDAELLRDKVGKAMTSSKQSNSLETASEESSEESHSLDNSPLEACKGVSLRANDIRSCGKNSDLKGALKIFDRLGNLANDTLILNSMLDACIECKDVEKGIEYFNQARDQNLADVISYNTMMKGYIANGQEMAAKKLLAELSHKGLIATRASYHLLLNARVNAKDFAAAWKLVADMQASEITPNAVTCSILLKGKMSSPSELARVIALIDSMDQPMDEVLFLSVVEACIRTRRLDLLSRQSEKFLRQSASASLTAPTYGSMIKAYGHARDVKRVWLLWDRMVFHRVHPTSVTLGCMVEALVANGRSDEAWKLAQKIWDDEDTRSVLNTVIYSSILKGFAYTKETDKVMALYGEMKSHGIQANTITYNTIMNAFAHSGMMHQVPALLEDMKAATPPVEPDIVTYSTILKGFCNAGNLDRALKVLGDMKASGKIVPDEVMYNSLLAGCAKEHRPDEALQLLSDMKKLNIAPSNYTLSTLVKLMGRCRRLSQAFTLLDDISKEYGLKINIQVYTCLIQGCFNAGEAGKALALHEKIIKEGLAPDSMTYTVLVRGCVQGGLLDKAIELTKIAYGRGPAAGLGASPGLNAGCFDELVSSLGEKSNAARELVAEVGDCQAAPATKGFKGGGKGFGKGAARVGPSDAPSWKTARQPASSQQWRA